MHDDKKLEHHGLVGYPAKVPSAQWTGEGYGEGRI